LPSEPLSHQYDAVESLRASSNLTLQYQMIQKCLYLGIPHGFGVSLLVEKNKASDPMYISFNGALGVPTTHHFIANFCRKGEWRIKHPVIDY